MICECENERSFGDFIKLLLVIVEHRFERLARRGLQPRLQDERETFQLGSGAPEVSQRRITYPAATRGTPYLVHVSEVGATAVSADLPLLGSKPFMTEAGMVLDMSQGTVSFRRLGANLGPLWLTWGQQRANLTLT